MRLPRLHCFAASIVVAGLSRAASFDDRVEALFRPPLGEMMALSPDGARVAYTTRAHGALAIVILNVEHPGPKRTVPVEPERSAAGAVGATAGAVAVKTAEPPPAQLRFLRWATPDRLLFAPTERVVPLPPVTDPQGRSVPNPDGPTVLSPIIATDADGKQRGTLVDARDFQETPAEALRSLADLLRTPQELAATRRAPVGWRMPHLDILGFHPRDRAQLVVGTRGAYSVPRQHLIDVRTGSVREFGDDWPVPPSEPQVYDWFRFKIVGERQDAARPTTAWRDADLARVQQELAVKFPRRIVELLDWSDTRARVLFRVTGGSDPGRVFVFQRPEDLVVEILHRAPWLKAAQLHETRYVEFAAPYGARLSGYLTWPGKPRVNPPPLLLVFPGGAAGRAQPAFDPEAQVFADLGFVVARLNHRDIAGAQPEAPAAARPATDRAAAEDARATIEWISARYPERPFDRKRVVALGREVGGYLALRALQLSPAVIRGAIAIDAPLEPPDREAKNGNAHSVLDHVEALTHPVLLLVEPGRSPMIDGATQALRSRLQALGRPPDHVALDAGLAAARPASRANVYRKIEEFLNLRLHDYTVKIGPTEEVK